MVSFIIPAHNEEYRLPATLAAIRNVIAEQSLQAEIILVNDDSNDRTESIAIESGVRVVNVCHRHIAATRNSGGRAAKGNYFFFVDADTKINSACVAEALAAMQQRYVGGGCLVRLEEAIPWYASLTIPFVNALCRRLKITGGACLFCRRGTFEKTGGFNERYFAAEDLAFVSDIKRWGQFFIPNATIITSARKLNQTSFWQMLPLLTRLIFIGPEAFRSRDGLELWYDQAVRDPADNESLTDR